MSNLEARLAIAEMSAKHFQDMETFQQAQATGCGRMLLECCIALGVTADHKDVPRGTELFFGTWTRDAILARIAEVMRDG